MISPTLATWHPSSWAVLMMAFAVPVSLLGAVLLRAIARQIRRKRGGFPSSPDLALDARQVRRRQLAEAEDVEARWR